MNREQYFGSLIIISGPSGVGKSTIFNLTKRIHPSMRFSVSCTTRARRSNEVEDMSYHFIDDATFDEHVKNDDFLEHAKVHGAKYGTLKSELECMKKGKDLLLDIDVQGMHIVKNKVSQMPFYNVRLVTVFILPPSMKELEKRLRGRGTEKEEDILCRLANARKEIEEWRNYDYVIINDDAEKASDQLDAIMTASHFASNRLTEEKWKQ